MMPKYVKFKPFEPEKNDNYRWTGFKLNKLYIMLFDKVENAAPETCLMILNGKITTSCRDYFVDPEPGDLGIEVEVVDGKVKVTPI